MRTILTGVVAFTLGAISSPRAANEDETLALLCARFQATAAQTMAHNEAAMKAAARTARGRNTYDAYATMAAVSTSLRAVERMVCPGLITAPASMSPSTSRPARLELGQ